MRLFLTFVVVVGLGAVVGAVVVGLRVFDGTVVDRPYERGLAWDEERERREAAELDVSIDGGFFRVGLNNVVVRVSRKGEPVVDGSVGLRLNRPGTGEHEKRYRALRRDDGAYAFPAVFPLPGRWEAVVVVERDGLPLEYRHTVTVEEHVPPAGPSSPPVEGIDCGIDEGPCTAAGRDGSAVTLEILPRPVRTMANLVFRLRFDSAGGGEAAMLHLDMPGMYMGENRIPLEDRGGGLYEGRGIIVRCPGGGRTWRAVVEEPAAQRVSFTFQVDAP
jgi:nitrogen fixation protein FixH